MQLEEMDKNRQKGQKQTETEKNKQKLTEMDKTDNNTQKCTYADRNRKIGPIKTKQKDRYGRKRTETDKA